MGFFSHGHIPVSFVFQGQYDAVWGLLPVEKARRRRTQAAELGCPDNIHGCCQDACPAILPAENQGKGDAKLPQCRRHALTMTKREAETCRVSLTFFLPYRPNGCEDSMATPNYLLTPAASVWRTRRVSAGEWKTARKDCPCPSRAVCLFAPQCRLSFSKPFKIPTQPQKCP